ncbi:fungal-specific transcription factor domain-containing protein [Xylariomycetidae sp. FL0641]|nr:fungal-specific transcription factor domain-containing protein [Xylariomycetidae sp. FL0641]
MTRPKVDPDKRQRTAQACDSCKRRKQKCNGLRPCNTCTKRHLDCQYSPTNLDRRGSEESLGSPPKRRHIDSLTGILKSPMDSGQSTTRRTPSLTLWNHPPDGPDMNLIKAVPAEPRQQKALVNGRQIVTTSDRDFDSRSRVSNASGAADEAEVYPSKRMLQDSTGRLLYVGDSASLSYLQWIRMIVESISGPSDFTVDPRRHMIMENNITLPPDIRPTGVLPDQRTADILIKSFFINTAGFVEVFDRHVFMKSVEECYKDPLNVTSSLLCLLYLVFAIGLVMAAPHPASDEEAIIEKLRSERANRAELFFRNAKSLADPVSGFEDADFWSIQALLLMSLYMLAVSKRNASYAYFGMAARSAFALGLHREESMNALFTPEEQRVRKNLWRTLFVLDRFLAACLGRPTAISEDDCSDNVFKEPSAGSTARRGSSAVDNAEATHMAALEAAVKSCRVIGLTLKKVYSKRKISTAVAQEIADHLEDWSGELHHALHWKRLIGSPLEPTQGIAILHTNLLHCHSVMLLTRPFFLYLIHKARGDCAGAGTGSGHGHKPTRISQRMESFAKTCVEASQHTLVLTQAVLGGHYLPQCNPFVMSGHCVFAAALIVLSNEFASLYHNPEAQSSIHAAITILRFCARSDAQADRVSYIVESFHKANEQRPVDARRLSLPGRTIPTLDTLTHNLGLDPVAHFFQPGVKLEFPRNSEQYPALSSTVGAAPLGSKDRGMLGPGPSSSSALPAASSTMVSSSSSSMLPPGIQQPSPEGSVSLNSGGMAAVTGGVAPAAMDPVSGGDSEFDFDSLWNWPPGSAGGMAVPPPPPMHHHPDGYAPFALGQPAVPPHAGPGPLVGMPLYPQGEYR